MRRVDQNIGRVLVLGLGKSGKSVARYCADLLGTRVESMFIAAGARNDDSEAFVESLAGEGVAYAFGDDALQGDLGRFDVCIASPGIPFWHELYMRGAELSDELISEVEFAWRESDAESTWVAITGTNGKTTTTSLAAHVLRECGYAANAVGNIGDVCLDAVAAGDTSVYVAEVSSYQTYSTRLFAPDVAVMLNITPDHIHWHQTLDAYAQAKFKLIDNMISYGKGRDDFSEAATKCRRSGSEDCLSERSERVPQLLSRNEEREPQLNRNALSHSKSVVILDATNDVVRAKVRELKAMTRDERGFDYVPMGTADGIHGDMRAKCGAENAAFLDEQDVLHVALDGVDHALAAASDLQIKGEHNASNALAAAAVAVALGADDAEVAAALASFQPLVHRIEPCGSVAGVACYNDSKATNVDATLKALAAFPGKRVIIMLGGDDKGTDLSELVAATYEHAAVAVCYGEGGPRFFDALTEGDRSPESFTCLQAQHMEDAFDMALSTAQSGDVVLLSPACASFDEFRSFEHRGDVFKQLVAARAAVRGA